MKLFKSLVNMMDDITPDKPLNLEIIKREISVLKDVEFEINPYISYISMLKGLLRETKVVIESLQKNNIDDLKNCLENTQYLFRGTCGFGMSYYVGHKAV
jgi:hypothetical protein